MSKNKSNTYVPASAKKAAQKGAYVSPEAKSGLLRKKKWTISIVSVLTAIVLTASLIIGLYQAPVLKEKDNDPMKAPTEYGSIPNGNFDLAVTESALTQYPYIVKDWKVYNENNISSIVGIIDTDARFEKAKSDLQKRGLTLTNPSVPTTGKKYSDEEDYTDSSRVLMLANPESTYSQVVSGSISVGSGLYKEISVWVKANVTEGNASIRLKSSYTSTADTLAEIGSIANNNEWTEYKFFVEASKTANKSLYLEVSLGDQGSFAKGTLFVDFARCNDSTKGDYIAAEKHTPAHVSTYTFDQDPTHKENLFQEAWLPSGTSAVSVMSQDDYATAYPSEKLPFYDSGDKLTKIYHVTNADTNVQNKGFAFGDMTIDSPLTECYRLSFWVKTKDTKQDLGAYLYLLDNNGEKYAAFSNVATNKENEESTYNGWVEYSFYIKPSNTSSYTLHLEAFLGKKIPNFADPATTGDLFLTDFELTKISQNEYATGSSSAIQKLDLSETNSDTISNGSFNTTLSNETGSYPLAATSWTVLYGGMASVGGNNTLVPNTAADVATGIVTKEKLAQSNISGLAATDFPNYGGDAMYAIENKTKTASGIRSATFTLTADSYYRISVLVKVKGSAKANVYLAMNASAAPTENDADHLLQSGTITSAALGNRYMTVDSVFDYGDGFYQYNFLVHTGKYAKTAHLELWNGSRDATVETLDEKGSQGVVLFDAANLTSLTSSEYDDMIAKGFTKEEVKETDENGTEVVKDITLTPKALEGATDAQANFVAKDLSKKEVIPETSDEEDDKEEEKPETPTTPVEPINWLLLSGVGMFACALIVIIVFITKRVKKQNKVEPPKNNYKR